MTYKCWVFTNCLWAIPYHCVLWGPFFCIEFRTFSSIPLLWGMQVFHCFVYSNVLECKCPPHASVTEHLVPSSQHCFGWSRSPGARFERSHTISCSFYPSWLAAMCCDQRPSAHVAFPDDIKHLPQLKARVTPPTFIQ